jgi:hypothetical protein
MSCKIIFQCIIKFRDCDLLLKRDTSSVKTEFYSFKQFLFYNFMLYTAEKYICFCGGLHFQDLNAQKFRPLGNYWLLKESKG